MADSSNNSTPSQFIGGLMAGLNGLGSNPLFNIGMGLMSAAKPYGNIGDSLMQANQVTAANQANQQNMAINRLNMQRQQAMMPLLNAYYSKAGALMGGGQSSAPSSAPPVSGGVAPTPSGTPSMQIDPNEALQLGTIGSMIGAPGAEALTKYPEAVTNAQKALQQQKQMQVQGPMAVLDSIATSPKAHVLVNTIPGMRDQWQQMAPQLGVDPQDPTTLTPENARAFATLQYNQLAGSAGLPPKPMPTQVLKQNRGLGDVRDIDPLTGKDLGGSPAVATDKYSVGGNVIEAPKALGVAKGLQPYDSALFGADQITPTSLEQAYQRSKANGDPAAALAGRDPIAAAKVSSYIAQRAQQDGVTGLAQAAQAQAYKAQQGVVDDFTSPKGTAGGQIQAINTAVAHIGALNPLIDAMQSGNMTLINRARIEYQKATGAPAPSNYEALANMAAGEVSKAVLAGGGSVGERDEVSAPFNSAKSPEALRGAISTVSTALAGKTEALRNSWDVGTQGSQGSFDKFLTAPTKKALGMSTGPAVPAIGTVSKGYKFVGGDPSKQSSWQKVGG